MLDVLAVAAIDEQKSSPNARIDHGLHHAAGGRGEKSASRALRIKPRIENPFGRSLKVSCGWQGILAALAARLNSAARG